MAAVLSGPDVSHHQGAVSWSKVAAAGADFAWCKATEGASFRDPRFAANWAGIHAAGLVGGAYHFLRAESSGAAQARHFLEVVGELRGRLAALDVETSGARTNPSLTQVRDFARTFAQMTGGHPLVVYTAGWWWRGIARNPPGAQLGPLWHARYNTTPGPLYGGWSGWTFWQHTDRGRVPGISGPCDLNRFAGTRAQLLALTRPGATVPPVPVPQETDDMFSDADRALLRDVQARLAAIIEPGKPRSLRERLDDIERAEIARDTAEAARDAKVTAALEELRRAKAR